jgi:hypothetical protein
MKRCLRIAEFATASLFFILLAVTLGCGGSSSETPAPLAPLPRVGKAPASGAAREAPSRKKPAAPQSEQDLLAPQEQPTWGEADQTDSGEPDEPDQADGG